MVASEAVRNERNTCRLTPAAADPPPLALRRAAELGR